MNTLIFDVSGRMANFRRFYSSVTPLSYSFPPRNTINGMLAAILGYKRDSYYNIFSRENFGIALSLNNRNGLRRLMLPTNYLNTDEVTISKLRGKEKVPTSVEYIIPTPPETEVSYRIYVVLLNEKYRNILEELERRVREKEPIYPVSLGPANCLAGIDWVAYTTADIIELDNESPIKTVKTVIDLDLISDDGIKFEDKSVFEGKKIVLEERLPPDFVNKREINGRSKNYIFEGNGDIIPVRLKHNTKVFKVKIKEEEIYGTFM